MGRNPDYMLRMRHQEAKERGDKIFDVGIPCIHGHLEGRRVQPHRAPCIVCSRTAQVAYSKARYHTDDEYRKRLIAAVKDWRARHPEKVKEYRRRQYHKNKAKR